MENLLNEIEERWKDVEKIWSSKSKSSKNEKRSDISLNIHNNTIEPLFISDDFSTRIQNNEIENEINYLMMDERRDSFINTESDDELDFFIIYDNSSL
ncbi:hypothetical protein AN396_11925 [Candidatus Epulonipiscium fishelsonii]|uniref:Uncharacterized protein n=1 Tax=Candidatus Epulonipiscium fishelsonii TaxID=77094 RepID=A0ACC8X8B1_9FIRM|nr:hypothetical protein AN396_11925 [Epulopiscium sp. SCG-B11WGA-EpuloA1]